MGSRTVFFDTQNLELSSYDRSRSKLIISGVDPQIGTIESIQLTGMCVPNYLCNTKSISIKLDAGEVDDKLDIKKENGKYIIGNLFAKILPFSSVDTFSLKWEKQNTSFGEEVSLGAPATLLHETLLNKCIIYEGLKKFATTVEVVSTGLSTGISFGGGVANDTFHIFPGIEYTFTMVKREGIEYTLDPSLTMDLSFDQDTPLSAEEVEMIKDVWFDGDSGVYTLHIPKETIMKSSPFDIVITTENEVVTIGSTIEVEGYTRYDVCIRSNGYVIFEEILLHPVNVLAHPFCLLPAYLSDRSMGSVFSGNSLQYPKLLRLRLGDCLTMKVTPANMESVYTLHIRDDRLSSVSTKKHVEVQSKTVEQMEFTLLCSIVKQALLKSSDLMYNAPTSTNTISTVNNISLTFWDDYGVSYPLFESEVDSVSLALKFASAAID